MSTPLSLLQARNTTGLHTSSDFRDYRDHQTRRLERLRKALKIQTRHTKNYKPKTISKENVQSDSRYLEIFFLLAERDWAHSREAKSLLESNDSSSKRKYIVSKLSRSKIYIKQAIDLIDESDKFLLLQTYIFENLLQATIYFESKRFNLAIPYYSLVRVGIQTLLTNNEFTLSEESKDTLKDFVSTEIDEALRIASFKKGVSRTLNVSALSKKQAIDFYEQAKSTHVKDEKNSKVTHIITYYDLIESIDPDAFNIGQSEQEASNLTEITWRNHKANLDDADVARSILNARKLEEDSDLTNVLSFDGILAAWQEGLDIIKDDIERIEAETVATHESNIQQKHIISTYISYNILFRRLQRDYLLISQHSERQKNLKSAINKVENFRDVIRLYDTVLQSTSQLLELPGVSKDHDLFDSLTTLDSFFKSQKIDCIGESYDLSGDKKTALALFKTANDLLKESQALTVEFPGSFFTNEILSRATESSSNKLVRSHALADIEHRTSQSSSRSYIANKINSFPFGSDSDIASKIADFNPKISPVSIKPVFFDIAFNYLNGEYSSTNTSEPINEPSMESKNNSEAESETKSTKRGFLGLWGR
ncbi:hypothetical protein NADFUDRAFT_84234 [Nadsonia fulvescens var. elongata DSM 6958]|uniref:Signal recognition particle subunit SRP68 n=1 Tax=Nadsonia fulvescens var. elongata DSM 6958 TaxID=857566 RepID=A0A1E3PDV3_9ASCO|nr:hypothetical protein NADFUDRAFT_84234 [Nadsonia fulvescens var. elongata DSM 6958]